MENPYAGIGKPEALKYNLAPKWSRRITKGDRYVYIVQDGKLLFIPCAAIMTDPFKAHPKAFACAP